MTDRLDSCASTKRGLVAYELTPTISILDVGVFAQACYVSRPQSHCYWFLGFTVIGGWRECETVPSQEKISEDCGRTLIVFLGGLFVVVVFSRQVCFFSGSSWL